MSWGWLVAKQMAVYFSKRQDYTSLVEAILANIDMPSILRISVPSDDV